MGPFDRLFMVTTYWVGINEKTLNYGTDKSFPDLPFQINIAFDQSSKQTGIAIMDVNSKLICVIDIVNCGLPSSDDYVRMIRKWINNNLLNLNVGYIICERAEQNARQLYVKKVLQKLIGVLDDFAAEYGKVCYQIDNKTWKKHYLKDSKFDGRRVKTELVKPAIVERTCDLYPDLKFYYRFMSGTDSADAVGIIHGFLAEAFVDGFKSNMKVCLIMPTVPRRTYTMNFVDHQGLRDLVTRAPDLYRSLPIVYYNSDMTLEDNARRVINFFDKGAILVTDDERTRSIWKFTADKEITAEHMMIVLR